MEMPNLWIATKLLQKYNAILLVYRFTYQMLQNTGAESKECYEMFYKLI